MSDSHYPSQVHKMLEYQLLIGRVLANKLFKYMPITKWHLAYPEFGCVPRVTWTVVTCMGFFCSCKVFLPFNVDGSFPLFLFMYTGYFKLDPHLFIWSTWCFHWFANLLQNSFRSVWIWLILLKLKTYCWNHCSKIIFKCINSTVGPIFNEKIDKKWNL